MSMSNTEKTVKGIRRNTFYTTAKVIEDQRIQFFMLPGHTAANVAAWSEPTGSARGDADGDGKPDESSAHGRGR